MAVSSTASINQEKNKSRSLTHSFEKKMNILLLAGSPSMPSRSTRLLQHVGDKLALLGHRHAQLQVRDLPAQALLHADFTHPDILAAQAQLAQADAIVISTPVYKAAYSGILKAFLDLLPQDGLDGKLVLPLATGGVNRTCWHSIMHYGRYCRPLAPRMSCPVFMQPMHRLCGLRIRDCGSMRISPRVSMTALTSCQPVC
jgi:NAD(P)H-dependent FMN reductase